MYNTQEAQQYSHSLINPVAFPNQTGIVPLTSLPFKYLWDGQAAKKDGMAKQQTRMGWPSSKEGGRSR
jgi:hypothetical protein